jgi:hypothetical protein
MQVKHCDRCKKVIKESARGKQLSVMDFGGVVGQLDLCEHCTPGLVTMISTYLRSRPHS